jgi:UDP-3-O-[3-hydroxymyristoyl] glucosamine N-acyltransferase
VEGDAALTLSGVRGLDQAGPEHLSFLVDGRRAAEVRESRAGAVIAPSVEAAGGRPAVIVPQPLLAIAAWLEVFDRPERPKPGVARGAWVHRSARLSRGVSVAAGATIGPGSRIGARTVVGSGAFVGADVEIGEDGVLYANVVIYGGCRIGDRCVLHAGAVIGSDGFGYVWDGERHRKIPQTGIVRLEDEVEVGANAAIDRATFGETVVGRGTKIDNLVQVGHNVQVGPHCIIVGQTGLAGSVHLGQGVVLGGQTAVRDHITIGDGAIAAACSAIAEDVDPKTIVSGMPALPHRQSLREQAALRRLPDLVVQVRKLQEELRKLQNPKQPRGNGS